MTKPNIGLYQEHISDLRKALQTIEQNGFDYLFTPIVIPQFYREYDKEPMKQKHTVFSRSDLLLEAGEWHNRFIAKLNEHIDCDSDDLNVRKHSTQTLLQELKFAEHLLCKAVSIRLKGTKTVNLARELSKQIRHVIIVEVPMVNPKSLSLAWRNSEPSNAVIDNITTEDPWNWWNKFRSYADFDCHIMVGLELSADLPSQEELNRWLGEPVSKLIIPTHVFLRNSQNYPVLSRAHQAVVIAFSRINANFIIKCTSDENGLRNYSDYLHHICNSYFIDDPMKDFNDVLEIPLQPLYDNLDSYTYEVFEKDPVKYLYYQQAIEQALVDKLPEEQIDNKTLIIMVVGAGRGPLVRSALNAAANTKRKVKIIVVEKNPNAIITLTSLIADLWPDKDIELISCDMREFTPKEKVDILVSELLGSFGDNELSPECLDGAQKHLKDDGISIPSKSTSYINPIMSSKLYNNVRIIDRGRGVREKIIHYAEQSETTYVVYLRNVYHIDDPKALFEFVHPNKDAHIDNTRFKTLQFDVKLDTVLHGFSGYFDTILYKDVQLSIHPKTHSTGMASWFPMFLPLADPVQLKAGQKIEVNFWRCVASHKVWYEWSVTEPTISHIHNHNGRHCPIYM